MARQTRYNIPRHVRDYIEGLGYEPDYSMDGRIQQWDAVRRSEGAFWNWQERKGGRSLKVHRRSVHPAKRVCDEWARLLMNDKTEVVCEDQECTDRLAELFRSTGFFARGQQLVSKAFALGTCGMSMWLDLDAGKAQVRRYDAKCTLPLSWDDDGVTECAFVTRAVVDGKQVDQLVMHLVGEDGGYVIRTRCWDKDGNLVQSDSVADEVPTGSKLPTFAVWVPIPNTFSDCSPYGESLYAHAVDQVEAVDMAYDAMVNEVDLGKLRIFVSDSLIERGEDGNSDPLPFGRDNTVFRKLDGMDEVVKEFAPGLRTEQQVRAYRTAWQTLGDSCGFGSSYFDVDEHGGVKTATEVASDSSELMRSIRMYENSLENAVAAISHAALACLRLLGESLPEEGQVHVQWDDSIITDTAADKAQDMAEVAAGLMAAWEYRVKWYGEDEETAKANDPGAAQAFDAAELG